MTYGDHNGILATTMETYDRAVKYVQECIASRSTTLAFYDIEADKLPDIPPHVTVVGIISCNLDLVDISGTNVTEIVISAESVIKSVVLNDKLKRLETCNYYNTIGISDIPASIENITINGGELQCGLPKVADRLHSLVLHNNNIERIPYYPNLKHLEIHNCYKLVEVLSSPSTRLIFSQSDPPTCCLSIIPDLHVGLLKCDLYIRPPSCTLCSRDPVTKGVYTKADPTTETDEINSMYKRINCLSSLHRVKNCVDVFKEELMQRCWHPDRVARWVEQGIDEMMMGV